MDQREHSTRLYDGKKHTVKQIRHIIGISKPTIYKHIEAER